MPITITVTTDSDPQHLVDLADFLHLVANREARTVSPPKSTSVAVQVHKIPEPVVASEVPSASPEVAPVIQATVPSPQEVAPEVAFAAPAPQEPAAVPPPPTEAEDNEPANTAPPIVDKNGYPWDARIHASSKALNADGSWRQRRNLDPQVLADVQTELRGGKPLVAAPPPPPPAPQVAAAPVVPAPPIQGPPPVPQTIAQLMPFITAAMKNFGLDMTWVNAACIKLGVPSLPALSGQPDLVPLLFEMLFKTGDKPWSIP